MIDNYRCKERWKMWKIRIKTKNRRQGSTNTSQAFYATSGHSSPVWYLLFWRKKVRLSSFTPCSHSSLFCLCGSPISYWMWSRLSVGFCEPLFLSSASHCGLCSWSKPTKRNCINCPSPATLPKPWWKNLTNPRIARRKTSAGTVANNVDCTCSFNSSSLELDLKCFTETYWLVKSWEHCNAPHPFFIIQFDHLAIASFLPGNRLSQASRLLRPQVQKMWR